MAMASTAAAAVGEQHPFWTKADIRCRNSLSAIGVTADIARFWLGDGLSAYDPKRTLAVHCGNDFDGGFGPYRDARLSR